MTISRTLLALTAAIALQAATGPMVAQAADSCTNAALRTGLSANLPDCRAYELVSPSLGHASGGLQPGGRLSADGKTFVFQTIDPPNGAQSSNVFNVVRGTRDATTGWSDVSLAPPMPSPSTVFQAGLTVGLSSDLTAVVEGTDQPLIAGPVPPGQNIYVRRSDGQYRLITRVGSPLNPFTQTYQPRFISWGNANFTNIYLQSTEAQLPSDPAIGNSTYAWSEDRGLRLIGVLPDHSLAPGGSVLPTGVLLQPASEDGKYVAFGSGGKLYLRIDDTDTVELGDINLDPTNPTTSDLAGVTPDGSKVVFTSRAQLAAGSNTGSAQQGRDLYSYDTGTGHLTDLTPDATDPNGADIRVVVGATPNGSHVYFTAASVLAPGAQAGHLSLYVWHDNRIDFVALADNLQRANGLDGILFSVTPDGEHATFATNDQLTAYDNTDPDTSERHFEVYKSTLGQPLVCVSCRTDGSRPTADSAVPTHSGLPPANLGLRSISADGRRVFFESRDAVIPGATSGKNQVFEYADDKVSALSDLGAKYDSAFLDTSPSGDDVFFNTFDALVPDASNGDYAVIDARVGGGFPVSVNTRCTEVACQAPLSSAPVLPVAASITIAGDGNFPEQPEGSKVTVTKVSTITGTTGSLKVKVPGKGRLTVSGSGLQTKRSNPTKAQTITVRLALTSSATKSLKKHRSFKTKVKVSFADGSDPASTATLTVTFKTASARKGR